MSRRDDLLNLVPEDSVELIKDIVDQIVFLEGKMTELKKLPFIEVNSKDASKQRYTPASKMYKEFLQQYINCIKVIEGVIYRDKRLEGNEVEESPLREWFRNHESNMDA